MSGSISFNSIPNNYRVPGTYIEIDNTRALRGLTDWPTKVVLIAQRLAAGTVAALIPTRLSTASQAATFFGRGSQLAHMAEAYFRQGRGLETWAIAIDDPGASVAATGTFTFAGTSTAAGAVSLLIGGRRVDVAVAAATAAAAVATAAAAAINANLDLAVTATAATNVVTVTARNKGLLGNDIRLEHSWFTGEALPAGITCTVVQMASGSNNFPLLQPALDAAGDIWFTDWIVPHTETVSIAALEAKLAGAFGPLAMRDGHAWTAVAGTFATLTTYGVSRNSAQVSALGVRSTSPTPPLEWISAFAAVCIAALAIDPARPVQTLQPIGLLAPPIAGRFTLDERNQLLGSGISTFRTGDDGSIFVERMVTTYRTNPLGAADTSYLDVETMKTLAYLRYDLRTLIALRFPRYKLADDGTDFARGQNVVTPKVIRGEIIARFKQWEANGLVEGSDQFKADLIVQRNPSDPNRVDALIPPDLVNQLRVMAAQIEFYL